MHRRGRAAIKCAGKPRSSEVGSGKGKSGIVTPHMGVTVPISCEWVRVHAHDYLEAPATNKMDAGDIFANG